MWLLLESFSTDLTTPHQRQIIIYQPRGYFFHAFSLILTEKCFACHSDILLFTFSVNKILKLLLALYFKLRNIRVPRTKTTLSYTQSKNISIGHYWRIEISLISTLNGGMIDALLIFVACISTVLSKIIDTGVKEEVNKLSCKNFFLWRTYSWFCKFWGMMFKTAVCHHKICFQMSRYFFHKL